MPEILDVNSLLANQYEPKRQYRWIIEINGIDAFTARTASRPKGSFGETVIDFINAKWFLAGKYTPDPIDITFNDPIAPSAAQKVRDWINLCYEAETGRAGYASFYKKDIKLKLLDGPGAVVEQWTMKGAWLQNIDFGPLDYSVEDPVQINCTMRYDRSFLEF